MIDAPPSLAAPPLASFDATVAGQSLRVLTTGDDRRRALIDLIDGARERIVLMFYIFAADRAGQMVMDAMVRAAQRGVEAVLLVDSFGSSATSAAFLAQLDAAGGRTTCFSRKWRSSYLIRNHQKLAVADRRVAITGGFNVADDYLGLSGGDEWHDLGVRIEGPDAARLDDWCAAMEDFTCHADGRWRELRRLLRQWDGGTGAVRWLVGGPSERMSAWAQTVRADLNAGSDVDMMMAYFSPGQGMTRRLGRLARRGTLRLILAAKSDNAATIGAARLLYGFLLKRRAQIFEYQPERLHAKLIIIDDVVYLGTANFDLRSLFVNLEIMMRIEDRAFAERMRAYFDANLPDCEAITREGHRARATLLTRIRWALSWLVVGVVDYTVTRRLNFGLPSPD